MSLSSVRALENPLVTILDVDFDRLEALAAAGESSGHPVAGFLAAELDRAVIRPAGAVAPNIVRMNARVAFRIDGRRDVQVRTLVYPEEYAQRADRDECISVLTPLGAALLGLKAGTGMAYMAPGGTEHHVDVVAVLQDDPADATGPAADGPGDAMRRSFQPHDDDPGPRAA